MLADGGAALAEMVFDKEGISVGRARDCDVSLKDTAKNIAPTHGYIQRVGNEFFYIDYGSKLGSLVNGRVSPGREMTSLSDGSKIRIGGYQLDLAIGDNLKVTAKAPAAEAPKVEAPKIEAPRIEASTAPAAEKPVAKATSARRKRTVEEPGTVLSIDPGEEGAKRITDKTNAAQPKPARPETEATEEVEEEDVAGLTMALSDFSTSDLRQAADDLRQKEGSGKTAGAPKKRNTKVRTKTDIRKKAAAPEVVDDSESDIGGLTMALSDLSGNEMRKAAESLKGGDDLPQLPHSKKRETGTRNIEDMLSRITAKAEPAENIALPTDDTPKVSDSMQGAAFTALKQISDQLTGRGDFETKEQIELFGKLIAQTLDITLDWLNKSLKGRAEFEGQFEAFVTMTFGRDKNPIKQVKDAMEVRRMPLDWKSGKDPEALKQQLVNAFRDLTQHQLGLMEGVQRAINEIMKKLDPKVVEEESAKNASGLFKSLGAEKRAWRQYALTYSELLGESGKLFNEVVFPNIRKGYLESHTRETPPPGKLPGAAKQEKA